jgi:hypothetical protein
MSMSMLFVHVDATCSCPCPAPVHVQISMFHVHAVGQCYFHAACLCCMSTLHAYTACPPMLHVHSRHSNLLLHVHVDLSMLHDYAARPSCISILHVHSTCQCCKPMIHSHAPCPCLHAACLHYAAGSCSYSEHEHEHAHWYKNEHEN